MLKKLKDIGKKSINKKAKKEPKTKKKSYVTKKMIFDNAGEKYKATDYKKDFIDRELKYIRDNKVYTKNSFKKHLKDYMSIYPASKLDNKDSNVEDMYLDIIDKSSKYLKQAQIISDMSAPKIERIYNTILNKVTFLDRLILGEFDVDDEDSYDALAESEGRYSYINVTKKEFDHYFKEYSKIVKEYEANDFKDDFTEEQIDELNKNLNSLRQSFEYLTNAFARKTKIHDTLTELNNYFKKIEKAYNDVSNEPNLTTQVKKHKHLN